MKLLLAKLLIGLLLIPSLLICFVANITYMFNGFMEKVWDWVVDLNQQIKLWGIDNGKED